MHSRHVLGEIQQKVARTGSHSLFVNVAAKKSKDPPADTQVWNVTNSNRGERSGHFPVELPVRLPLVKSGKQD